MPEGQYSNCSGRKEATERSFGIKNKLLREKKNDCQEKMVIGTSKRAEKPH